MKFCPMKISKDLTTYSLMFDSGRKAGFLWLVAVFFEIDTDALIVFFDGFGKVDLTS